MKSLGPNEFIDFLHAYFGNRVGSVHRRSSHYTIPIAGIRDSITIPTNEDPIPIGTFKSLLRKCEITTSEFEQLAGNRVKLKKFLKSRK